jgi:hypothetical protein
MAALEPFASRLGTLTAVPPNRDDSTIRVILNLEDSKSSGAEQGDHAKLERGCGHGGKNPAALMRTEELS